MRESTLCEKCTILVNTCDAFEDVWDLFFTAFKIQWKDCEFSIVLNTETKKCQDTIVERTINWPRYNGKDCWGKRFKNALKNIETPYVIPILEDFVLKDKFTGQDLINNVMEWMDNDSDIGVFYIHNHPYVTQEKTEYDGFGLMPQKAQYKLTTAIGVWRKDYLMKCIKGIESPWEWELYSTKSAWKHKEKIYALLEQEPTPYKIPFGGAIRRGLWHPEAVKLAEMYGVKIDFSKRGFMNVDDPYREKENYSIRASFPKGIVTSEFWVQVKQRIIEKIRKVIIEI